MLVLRARSRALPLHGPPKGDNQALLNSSILTACMQAVKIEEFKSKLMGLRSKTKAQQIFDLKRRLILSFT